MLRHDWNVTVLLGHARVRVTHVHCSFNFVLQPMKIASEMTMSGDRMHRYSGQQLTVKSACVIR
jgi:hypothetical protein